MQFQDHFTTLRLSKDHSKFASKLPQISSKLVEVFTGLFIEQVGLSRATLESQVEVFILILLDSQVQILVSLG